MHERSQIRTKRIAWSALTGLLSSGAVALMSLFSAPITINYLGKELYGIWVIITSFLLWAQLFDFGILNGLTTALSEAFGRDDYETAKKYVCTAFCTTALIGCLGSIPWTLLSLHIPWHTFIKTPIAYQNSLSQGISIVGIFFFLTLPFTLFQRILHASQKFYIAHLINFITYLLALLALLIGVHLRFSLLQLLLITSAFPLTWYICCGFFIMRQATWTRFSFKHVQVIALKRLCISSFPILLSQCITIGTYQLIPLLLATVTTLREVADFGVLWKIYMFIFYMMINVAAVGNPGIRDAYERGEIDWIKRSLKRIFLALATLMACGAIALLFIGNQVVQLWIRMPLDHSLSKTDLFIYASCLLFAVLNGAINAVFVILDKMRMQILLLLFSSSIILGTIYWGVPRFGLVFVFLIMALTCGISFFCSLYYLHRILDRKLAIKLHKNSL